VTTFLDPLSHELGKFMPVFPELTTAAAVTAVMGEQAEAGG
jgi:hypothetical protein